jgi:predicted Zn-dependent protease
MTIARRTVLGNLCWCSALALAACGGSLDRPTSMTPGEKPLRGSDESELWEYMRRSEEELKRSRHLVRDETLVNYVRDVACRLAQEHCPDVRVYILRTPFANASMAPNGMMQVWTGLLLRMQNEAQMAAILGHEIGHYMARHTVQLYRDANAAIAMTTLVNLGLSLAGAGAFANLTGLAALAGVRAFSREHEREADEIGFRLVEAAGYRPAEVSRVWEYMLAESKAGKPDSGPVALFATHPPHEERMKTMRARAEAGGTRGEAFADRYRTTLAGLRPMLFQDELRLGRYDRSLVLFREIAKGNGEDAELAFWTGEAHRMRDGKDDRRLARDAYQRAVALGGAPAETWRSLGVVARRDGDKPTAETAFRRYLELRPDAPDRDVIRSYLPA